MNNFNNPYTKMVMDTLDKNPSSPEKYLSDEYSDTPVYVRSSLAELPEERKINYKEIKIDSITLYVRDDILQLAEEATERSVAFYDRLETRSELTLLIRPQNRAVHNQDNLR